MQVMLLMPNSETNLIYHKERLEEEINIYLLCQIVNKKRYTLSKNFLAYNKKVRDRYINYSFKITIMNLMKVDKRKCTTFKIKAH